MEIAGAKPTGAAGELMGGLTEYEIQRAAHIRRNMEYMQRLGLLDSAKELADQDPPEKVKRVKKPKTEVPDAEKRRSSRLLGVKAEMPEGLDMAESSDDEERPRQARKRGASMPGRDVLEDAREWLEQTRKALLEVPAPSPGSKDCTWKAEATRRWGEKVVCTGDWETFTRSRLATPPPPSPHQLLQEFYAVDPWQMLCACALMSRVSSWSVKHVTIPAFFERFPTPSSFVDANAEEVQVLLHPLGLFPTRMQTLVAVTRRFLEAPLFTVGLEPEVKIYGIGQFSVDSYRLFCRGDLKTNPEDRNLKMFVEWQRKNAAKGEKGGIDKAEAAVVGTPAGREGEAAAGGGGEETPASTGPGAGSKEKASPDGREAKKRGRSGAAGRR